MAPSDNRAGDSSNRVLPTWILYPLVGLLVLLALLIVGVFTYAALTPDSDVLPYRWRAWWENVTGDGKVFHPQAEEATPHHASPPRPTPAPGQGPAALAPVEAADKAADEAVAAYRASNDDPKLVRKAQDAIEALRRQQVSVPGDQAMQSAIEDLRDEKVAARQKALEDARRVARATHEVTGTRESGESPYLVLRAAAHPQARDVAHLNDGDRVHQFLNTGGGWARVEVLTGPATGQNGYVRDKYLHAVRAAEGK